MTIIDLSDEPVHIPELARWHHAEWSYLNPDDTVENRIEKMQAYLGDDLIPSTYICKEGESLAGSASIVKHDMHTHREWSPWLASVYVTPKFRNRGIGSRLVKHVMEKAREGGVEILYLFTPDREVFYKRLGWEVIVKDNYQGAEVTIMQIDLIIDKNG